MHHDEMPTYASILLHAALGYKPLRRSWAKVELFLGCSLPALACSLASGPYPGSRKLIGRSP